MPAPLPLNDGDTAFVGVNQKLSPDKLKPGFVSDAVNVRFDNGVIKPRKGLKKVGWVNQTNTEITSHSTGGRHIGFKPFSNVKGVGKFSDPIGVNWLIIASAEGSAGSHKVHAMTAGNDIQTINTDLTFDANDVTFVQCFNVVIK